MVTTVKRKAWRLLGWLLLRPLPAATLSGGLTKRPMRYLYLMLALCLPFAAVFTALAVWMDTFGLVWLAVVVLLLACPPYAVGAMKLLQRIGAGRE